LLGEFLTTAHFHRVHQQQHEVLRVQLVAEHLVQMQEPAPQTVQFRIRLLQ
jgi:hypothetical protein